jgi:hypothetical protein
MKHLTLGLFILLCNSVFAQNQSVNGCIVYPYNAGVSYAGRVFTQNIGFTPTTQSTSSPVIAPDIMGTAMYNGGINISGPNVPVNVSCYKEPVNTSLRECSVRFQTSNTTPAVYSYYGGVLAQNYYACPIDDYIGIFVPFLGILGFLFIKRRITFTYVL